MTRQENHSAKLQAALWGAKKSLETDDARIAWLQEYGTGCGLADRITDAQEERQRAAERLQQIEADIAQEAQAGRYAA